MKLLPGGCERVENRDKVFLLRSELAGWRFGSSPVIEEGAGPGVRGAMASVSLVRRFSRTSKGRDWEFASFPCFFSMELKRLSKFLTFFFFSARSRVRPAMDEVRFGRVISRTRFSSAWRTAICELTVSEGEGD